MERFFRRHPRLAAAIAIPALAVYVCLIPAAIYGGGWALASVGLNLAWPAILLVELRWHPRWARRFRHPLRLAFLVLVLVALLFPFVARLIGWWVPAWVALAVALAMSGLVVAWVRPAMRAQMQTKPKRRLR